MREQAHRVSRVLGGDKVDLGKHLIALSDRSARFPIGVATR
jgi:hypothetical protein